MSSEVYGKCIVASVFMANVIMANKTKLYFYIFIFSIINTTFIIIIINRIL